MFAVVQPLIKFFFLSLTPEAYAAVLLNSLWEGGKNKNMQLILGKGKGVRACSLFWKREGGQEHVARFGKSGESPFLSPCIYNPQSMLGCLGPRLSLPPF